jgi:hypothetical protein
VKYSGVALFTSLILLAGTVSLPAAEIVGVTVTPHVIAPTMRYFRKRDDSLAARVQLFVKGTAPRGASMAKRRRNCFPAETGHGTIFKPPWRRRRER